MQCVNGHEKDGDKCKACNREASRRFRERKRLGITAPSRASWPDGYPAYRTVHWRLYRDRGRAKTHICTCGAPAEHWSYRGGSPDERKCPKYGCMYTHDLSYYEPLCKKCHWERDGFKKNACSQGHDMSDGSPNVRLVADPRNNRAPWRQCIECHKRWQRTYDRRRRKGNE